jgi:hypothetical protein
LSCGRRRGQHPCVSRKAEKPPNPVARGLARPHMLAGWARRTEPWAGQLAPSLSPTATPPPNTTCRHTMQGFCITCSPGLAWPGSRSMAQQCGAHPVGSRCTISLLCLPNAYKITTITPTLSPRPASSPRWEQRTEGGKGGSGVAAVMRPDSAGNSMMEGRFCRHLHLRRAAYMDPKTGGGASCRIADVHTLPPDSSYQQVTMGCL